MRQPLGLTGLWDRFEARITSAAAGMLVVGYEGDVTGATRLQHAIRVSTDMRNRPPLLTQPDTAH